MSRLSVCLLLLSGIGCQREATIEAPPGARDERSEERIPIKEPAKPIFVEVAEAVITDDPDIRGLFVVLHVKGNDPTRTYTFNPRTSQARLTDEWGNSDYRVSYYTRPFTISEGELQVIGVVPKASKTFDLQWEGFSLRFPALRKPPRGQR